MAVTKKAIAIILKPALAEPYAPELKIVTLSRADVFDGYNRYLVYNKTSNKKLGITKRKSIDNTSLTPVYDAKGNVIGKCDRNNLYIDVSVGLEPIYPTGPVLPPHPTEPVTPGGPKPQILIVEPPKPSERQGPGVLPPEYTVFDFNMDNLKTEPVEPIEKHGPVLPPQPTEPLISPQPGIAEETKGFPITYVLIGIAVIIFIALMFKK